MRARRELGLAVLLCLVGASLVLGAAAAGWIVVQLAPAPPLPTRTTRLTGTALVPVRSLGLLALAGVVALLATKRIGRAVVGAILVLAGSGIAVLSVGVGLHPRARAVEAGIVGGTLSTTAAPWVAVAGGALIALAGVLVAVRGRRWAAMSDRYDNPSARRAAPAANEPLGERALWEALDKGHDPTGTAAADPPGPSGPEPAG